MELGLLGGGAHPRAVPGRALAHPPSGGWAGEGAPQGACPLPPCVLLAGEAVFWGFLRFLLVTKILMHLRNTRQLCGVANGVAKGGPLCSNGVAHHHPNTTHALLDDGNGAPGCFKWRFT